MRGNQRHVQRFSFFHQIFENASTKSPGLIHRFFSSLATSTSPLNPAELAQRYRTPNGCPARSHFGVYGFAEPEPLSSGQGPVFRFEFSHNR